MENILGSYWRKDCQFNGDVLARGHIGMFTRNLLASSWARTWQIHGQGTGELMNKKKCKMMERNWQINLGKKPEGFLISEENIGS
jgi:hypothetical protein